MTVWDRYPNLTDAEFRTLVAVTAQTLQEGQADPTALPPDLLSIPSAAASREALPPLREADPTLDAAEVQRALEDDRGSREVCSSVLDEVRKQPELAAAVADAFESRRHKLAAPELILFAGALLVLAVKVKDVRLTSKDSAGGGNRELVIRFGDASTALKNAVAHIIRVLRGG